MSHACRYKPLPLVCIQEVVFSSLWSAHSGVAGALRTSCQALALTSDVVVSLFEGDLGYLQLICRDFHTLVNYIYTQIMSVLCGQDSVKVTLFKSELDHHHLC